MTEAEDNSNFMDGILKSLLDPNVYESGMKKHIYRPATNPTDPNNTSHFRYAIDNLLELGEKIENAEKTRKLKANIEGRSYISERLTECRNLFTKSNDSDLLACFHNYVMDIKQTKYYIWHAKSNIKYMERMDYIPLLNVNKKTVRYPIGELFKLIHELTDDSYTRDSLVSDPYSSWEYELAKAFFVVAFIVIDESIKEDMPAHDLQAHKARKEQCLDKLFVLDTQLGIRTRNDSTSWIDMLLSKANAVGPDGQPITANSLMSVLGDSVQLDGLMTIINEIKDVMVNGGSPDEAYQTLQKSDLWKSATAMGKIDEFKSVAEKMTQSGIFAGLSGLSSDGPEIKSAVKPKPAVLKKKK